MFIRWAVCAKNSSARARVLVLNVGISILEIQANLGATFQYATYKYFPSQIFR